MLSYSGCESALPNGNGNSVNVPYVCDLLYVIWVLVISKPGELSIAACLPIVLGSGLAIHSKYSAPRLANETTEEVNVIDLASAGCRLV